jgi:hypothetical protein
MTEPHAYALHYGRSTKLLAWVVPDDRWPKMWRIRWPDGRSSDMVNLARAKDAAAVLAQKGPPARDRSMFHWKLGPLGDAMRPVPDALNEVPGWLVALTASTPQREPAVRIVAGHHDLTAWNLCSTRHERHEEQVWRVVGAMVIVGAVMLAAAR